MLTVIFGENEYDLDISWKASKEFGSKVGDPLLLAIGAANGENVFDTPKTITAIFIGMKNAGSDMQKSEVAELCHKYGMLNYYTVAAGYLVALVSGESDGDDSESDEKK